jgi:hypothetical protein
MAPVASQACGNHPTSCPLDQTVRNDPHHCYPIPIHAIANVGLAGIFIRRTIFDPWRPFFHLPMTTV